MRYLSILIFVGFLAGCSQTDAQPMVTDAQPMVTDAQPMVDPVSFAGNWAMKAYLTEGVSVLLPGGDRYLFPEGGSPLLQFGLTATDTHDGWSIKMRDRDPVPANSVAFADNRATATVTFDPFLSSIGELEGVSLSLTAVLSVDSGLIVGVFTGTYDVEEPPYTLVLTLAGTQSN